MVALKVWVRVSDNRHVWAEWEPNATDVAEALVVASLLGTGKADILEIVRGIAYGAETLCRHVEKFCDVAKLASELEEKLGEAMGDW